MKSIIFDLDGTLLDSLEDLYVSTNYVLKEMHLPPRSREEVRSFVGNGARILMGKAIGEGEAARIEEALALFRAHYGAHSADHTRPYPGIPALLDRLQREGYGMAIVSNKPDFAVKDLCREYFPQVSLCLGDREGVARKPAPDAVWEAMKLLSSEPQECVYVGDSEVDVATAQNARIPCVAVLWGFRDRSVLGAQGATFFADSADALYERISEAMGK
ncbi:MAG: HAD-IA family hydrolase [Clostridia bacterium]|nr:HAD-IA family hydrolase [Clostridia bacterium]